MEAPIELQQEGLVHDMSEAFLSDIPSPFKRLLPDYRALENVFQTMIYTAFDLSMSEHPLIRYFDTLAGLTEARDLHPFNFFELDWVIEEDWEAAVNTQEPIEPLLDWRSAKQVFLDRAEQLNLTHIGY
jgi:hypothetical protein